jgi:DNA repair protein SbcC/Rad50
MRLKHLKLKDLGRFQGIVEIPFSELPDGIIAFVGPNGSGKTTLLETTGPAAMFREWPTRMDAQTQRSPAPFLYMCHARDSFLDLTFDHAGQEVRILLRGDRSYSGGRGKQEGFVWVDGRPVVTSGKTGEFDAWISANLITRPMLYSNLFTVQKESLLNDVGSFGRMKKAARSSFFAEMLGCDHLQEKADTCGQVLAVLQPALDRVREQLDGFDYKAAQIADLEQKIADLSTDIETQAAKLEQATQASETAAAEQQAAAAKAHEAKTQLEQLAQLRQDIAAKEGRLETIRSEIKKGQDYLEKNKEHPSDPDEAQRKLEEVERDLEQWRQSRSEVLQQLTSAKQDHAYTSDRLAGTKAQAEQNERELAAAQTAAAELADLQGGSESIETIDARIADLEQQIGDLKETETALLDKLTKRGFAEGKRDLLRETIEEAKRQAGLLGEVPCEGKGKFSACELLTGAQDNKTKLADLKPKLETLEAEIAAIGEPAPELQKTQAAKSEAVAKLDKARVDGNAARQLQVDGAALRVKAEKIPELEQTKEKLATDCAATEKHLQTRADQIAEALQTSAQALSAVQAKEADQQNLREAVKVAGYINRATQEIEDRTERATDLETELGSLRSRVPAELPDQEAADQIHNEAKKTTADSLQAVETARRIKTAGETNRAQLQGRVRQIGDVVAEQAKAEKLAAELRLELGAWSMLRSALGRDGIQILEIDAAGPKVSEIANALLAETYGERFQIRITTLEARKNPRPGESQYKDVFSLRVMDNDSGREELLESLSGGEEVILADALKDSLAIYMNQQLAGPLQTMWADESGAALDENHRASFFDRKRRAMKMNGIRQFFIVSHDRDVWENADAIVRVDEAGGVTLKVQN